MKCVAALTALAAIGMSPTTHANDTWPHPGDIPAVPAVTVGLAGEYPADVVRYLLAEGARDFRLSPDGARLAFEWAVSGEPQLWLVSSNGGWPTQLTFGSGITFFEWLPNGRQLIIGRDADGNEREGYYLLSDDGQEEQLVLPLSDAFRTFGMFSADGTQFLYSSTERNGRDFDIYLKDLNSGENRRVYEGTFGFFPSAWQPDGDLVIVSETRGEDANDVHLLNLADGKMTPLFTPTTASLYDNFAWLPDGSGFYMTTNVDREFAGLAFYDLESTDLRFIESPQRDIDGVSLSGDGRFLAWTENDDGYSRLRVRDLERNTDMSPPALPDGVHRARYARSAPVLGVLTSGPSVPGDVRTWRVQDRQFSLAVQSSLGGLDPDRFVAPESLRYPARDGIELQGLLYLPPASAVQGKPPVVVQVHGGPTAQSRPGFRMLEQYLVNNGIAVFAVNVRGSTGFGKTYTRLDNQEKRLDSVRDLVDTVAFLSKRDDINTNRIAVMGGSYGGYMVNAVLGAYPGVFDAGISVVGVSDWVRALQEASPGLKASDRIEYGDIREPRWQRFYADNSPINNAHLINVPLMVAHGANDPRDPVSESDRIVEAVRDAGFDVTYMRFPDEGHSFRKRGNRIAYYRQIAEFLDRHLKSADTTAP